MRSFFINSPFKKQRCQLVTMGHPGLTYILNSDMWALWHSALNARVPECQKLKMYCRLDLDGTEHFEM